VIHVLQKQEQRMLMREDHEVTLLYIVESASEVKNYKMRKYNKIRKTHVFRLVPITRKIITNTTSVGGGQMQNTTNMLNWNM